MLSWRHFLVYSMHSTLSGEALSVSFAVVKFNITVLCVCFEANNWVNFGGYFYSKVPTYRAATCNFVCFSDSHSPVQWQVIIFFGHWGGVPRLFASRT